ncbi:MAG: hypothetical protein U5K71_12735 [Gracilimonas sp.]|nr:hypothetical protein [Gracilimonas sp.]
MAKTKTQFECSNCGYISPKWNGSCPSCGEWNTFVEKTVTKENHLLIIKPKLKDLNHQLLLKNWRMWKLQKRADSKVI